MRMIYQQTIKDLDYYLALPYTIELTPDKEGYWFAFIGMSLVSIHD
jgi:hypothetical protein